MPEEAFFVVRPGLRYRGTQVRGNAFLPEKQARAPPGRSMLRELLPGTRRRSDVPRRAAGKASWQRPGVDGG